MHSVFNYVFNYVLPLSDNKLCLMGLHYMITFILYIPFPFIFYIHWFLGLFTYFYTVFLPFFLVSDPLNYNITTSEFTSEYAERTKFHKVFTASSKQYSVC
jgi:hypothetical protein